VYHDTPVRAPVAGPRDALGRGENVSVRTAIAVRRGLSALTAAVFAASVAACDNAAPAAPSADPSAPAASLGPDLGAARSDLAARAALAVDRKFAALYTFEAPGEPSRAVVATVAADGSWRVDIAGGAQGGLADVSIVQNATGVFQCSLSSATNPINPTCVRVADTGKQVPADYDPKVERVFRQWLKVFTDRQAALSVTTAQPLPGSPGSACFSIDSISASMSAPVDVGIYCYAPDGLLTAAKVDFGTLAIASQPAAAPAAVDLPGPIVAGQPLGLDRPPPTTAPAVIPSVAPSA
jgi:hypothetical protein